MTAPSQLPLALDHEPEYGRESFIAGPSNSAALALVDSWPRWPSPVVLLTGPPGSGKTHLATIWSTRAAAAFVDARDLPALAQEPLAARTALVIEDIRAEDVPERVLFHLINAAHEAGASLLVTARQPPSAWRIELPDLRSRLRMATPAVLEPPDDDLLRRVLVKLFADRQLIVERAVIDYLLLRMERSLTAAAATVSTLDREALATGRPITRPLAAHVLTLAGEPEHEDSEFPVPQ